MRPDRGLAGTTGLQALVHAGSYGLTPADGAAQSAGSQPRGMSWPVTVSGSSALLIRTPWWRAASWSARCWPPAVRGALLGPAPAGGEAAAER